jgi:hypothetical protein
MVNTGRGSMDFNSSVQDWARLRPPQHGNVFTCFIRGHKLLDHTNGYQILQEILDDGARLRTLLFLSRLLHYPGTFINLLRRLDHDITGITELHLKM